MVAYNFKKRFVPLIPTGRKRHTIRGQRKRHARPGEVMQLQHGPRMKPVRIGTAICLSAEPIRLSLRTDTVSIGTRREPGGYRLIHTQADLDSFAQSDGFADWADMKAFWVAEHATVDCFDGVLIAWDYDTFKPANPVAPQAKAKGKSK